MSILLDSASLSDATAAAGLGFVRGVTTNPTLMRSETADPLGRLAELLATVDFAEIYYQPTGAYGPLREEAEKAFRLDDQRVVLKLPATPDGVALAGAAVRLGARVSLTAAQSPQAMVVAESIGATAGIPYVDRAQRDLRVGPDLVRALARVRRGPTRIVAASVKSAGQLLQAYEDGADAVTAPLAVLETLLHHPAALEAEHAFAAEYGSD
jgi:transaldolase